MVLSANTPKTALCVTSDFSRNSSAHRFIILPWVFCIRILEFDIHDSRHATDFYQDWQCMNFASQRVRLDWTEGNVKSISINPTIIVIRAWTLANSDTTATSTSCIFFNLTPRSTSMQYSTARFIPSLPRLLVHQVYCWEYQQDQQCHRPSWGSPEPNWVRWYRKDLKVVGCW